MAKLSLRYGDVSIDYEGPEEFLKDQLPAIVKAVGALKGVAPPNLGPKVSPGSGEVLSASTVAHKLSVKTGPDLLAAAAYSLALSGTSAFKKKELRAKAREVKTIWRKSYSNNFDTNLNSLVTAGRLNHVGGEDYAIPEAEQSSISSRLAAGGAAS